MLPLVRLPLRLDRGNSHVTGKEILAALEKLAKDKRYYVHNKLEKYYESGQYYSFAVTGISLGLNSITVLISVGNNIDSAKSEIKLNESYDSWHVYVENKPDYTEVPGFQKQASNEELVNRVKEIRDCLGQILKNG